MNESWSKEILRRAGDAPLWVRGTTVGAFKLQPRYYIWDLLNEEWDRIQILDIDLRPLGISQVNEQAQIWEVMLHPAPVLLTAILVFPIQLPFAIPLFSYHAPQLTEFHMPCFPVNLRAPWISQIQNTELIRSFTLLEVLGGLMNMRAIRCLSIQNIPYSGAGISEPPSRIQLPHLGDLRILGYSLLSWTSIVNAISPAPGCSFQRTDSNESASGPPSNETLDIACRQLFKFLESFLTHSPPRDCLMVLYDAHEPAAFHILMDDGRVNQTLRSIFQNIQLFRKD